jgi:HlyD family secretion protein
MDKPLSKEVKRKVLLRRTGIILLIILIPFIILLFLKNVINQKVSLSKVTIASVEQGSIQITVQGSGIVIPAYEEVIISPFRSSVVKIVRRPGSKLSAGDTLLVLNNKLAGNDLDMLKNERDLQRIRAEKLKIELLQLQEDFEFSGRIREIKVENAKLAYEAESTLNKMGGSPAYNVKKAKTDWEISQLESEQAQYNFNNEVNARNNSIRELETEMNIQENKIIKAKELVDQAYVKAPFNEWQIFQVTS